MAGNRFCACFEDFFSATQILICCIIAREDIPHSATRSVMGDESSTVVNWNAGVRVIQNVM